MITSLTTPLLLDRFTDDLRRCAICHDQCLFATAEVYALGRQTVATSRKALLFDLARRGKLLWSTDLAEVAYAGLASGVQHAFCVHHGDPAGWPDEAPMLRAARADLVAAGVLLPAVAAIRERFATTADPFAAPRGVARPGKLVLFVDSATRALQPEIATAARTLLAQLEPGFGELATHTSGYELFDLGLRTEAAHAIRSALAALVDLGATTVVTESPEAAVALTAFAAELGLAAPGPVLHLSQWLAEKLPGDLELRAAAPLAVTYHDPDRLGRGLGAYAPPRRLLGRVVGLQLIEMRYHGEQALLAGPTLGYPFPAAAAAIAQRRAEEAAESGATLVVTASPYDKHHLGGVATSYGLTVVDLAELLVSASAPVAGGA